ncbi:hypothetical protein CH373_00030 [Leptospira perolatii]|uniref:Lipoprotein n=1 Tax=Leptospira perolatii TaxID=2023191 RepID=A0A2M9ZRA9_9LEPT|nr:hypothetical protein [Leptospira perolatii]PJZ70967.1 hypothetical protein CH360_00030 [Leptospira perolatii]PJZ74499.1 hypothetical protein CH373_00030 [Leptospira perolatii]
MNLSFKKSKVLLLLFFSIEICSLSFCNTSTGGNRALVRRNPEPYPAGIGLSLENDVHVNGANFRDPSIHYGASSTKLKTFGFDGWIRSTTSLPFKDMFHATLDGWDWSKYRIVRFAGDSKGCQSGVSIVLPLKQGSRDAYVPISFVFGPKSFYEELKEQMEAHDIQALFDSRLDIENTSYVLGIFRKKCIRFRSYGIQKF